MLKWEESRPAEEERIEYALYSYALPHGAVWEGYFHPLPYGESSE